MVSGHISLSLIASFGLCLYFLVQRYRRLSSVPGPWLASLTDLWRAHAQNYRQFTQILLQLHDQYGPLVRIGPNMVSVSDAKAVPSIYTTHGEFTKGDSYHTLRALSGGVIRGSIADIQDEKYYTDIRRALAGSFSARNVLDYEEDIEESLDALIQCLVEHKTLNIFEVSQQFQIDFLMKAAFSQTPHFLETQRPTRSWSFDARYRHWKTWQALPYIEHLVFKSSLGAIFTKRATPSWAKMAMECFQGRRQKSEAPSSGRDLTDKYLEAQQKNPQLLDDGVMLRMITSTISAGFDTTAATISSMIYLLLQNPEVLRRLLEEVQGANLSNPPKWSEVHDLHYLDAVMKEALRCYPFLTMTLDRVVPPEGATICGTYLPGGTDIGCHASVVHRDRTVFGDDADQFRPERWLTTDREQLVAMERGFLAFGSGKRVCIGRHLADLEVKKVIPQLLKSFKMSLIDPNTKYELDDPYEKSFIPKPILVKFEPSA